MLKYKIRFTYKVQNLSLEKYLGIKNIKQLSNPLQRKGHKIKPIPLMFYINGIDVKKSTPELH